MDADSAVNLPDNGTHSPPANPTPSIEALQDYYGTFTSALLVGEGDFSFTGAFRQVFQGAITATEFSTDLVQLYYDGDPSFIQSLATQYANIHHLLAGVDAKLLATGPDGPPVVPWNTETRSFDHDNSEPALFWKILQTPSTTHKTTPPLDLIIFNCPHTDKRGKAAQLLRIFFQQVRICVDDGRMAATVVVELRLRDLTKLRPTLKRVDYQQEDAARRSQFKLVGVYPNDVPVWESLGYQHKTTRRNATCRGLPCQVWRWRCTRSIP